MYFNTSDNSENFYYVFNFNNDNNNINAENVNSFLASVCNIVLFEPIDTDGDGYNEILCINKINETRNKDYVLIYSLIPLQSKEDLYNTYNAPTQQVEEDDDDWIEPIF